MPKAVLTIQKIASSFPNADQAAAVSVPNVLTEAMMAIFVIAKRMDSNPVGSPSFNWFFSMGLWKRISLSESFNRLPECISLRVTRTELTA